MASQITRQMLIVGFGETVNNRFDGQPSPFLLQLLGALGPLQGVLILAPNYTNRSAAGEQISDGSETRFGFCAVTVRWPGRELVEVLRGRWAETFLQDMVTLPSGRQTGEEIVTAARMSVQRWFTQMKLSPPLLLDHLAAETPPLPVAPEAGCRPGGDLYERLDRAAWQWQENWSATSGRQVQSILSTLAAAWPQRAETWLAGQLAGDKAGTVVMAQCYLAAVSELLRAFEEGVSQKLEDIEDDLISLEQHLSRLARTFAGEPGAVSPDHIRQLARLTTLRLQTLQASWHVEAVLPFYRQMQASWQQTVKRWQRVCRQIGQAAGDRQITEWTARLPGLLTEQNGPWQETLVESLYQEAVQQQPELTWPRAGPLASWAAAGIAAPDIIRQLLDYAAPILSPVLDIPLAQAMQRQLPQASARQAWLVDLANQVRASPYLVAVNDGETSLRTWLLLPEAKGRPLAGLGQTLPGLPHVLPSPSPQSLAMVMLRRQESNVFPERS